MKKEDFNLEGAIDLKKYEEVDEESIKKWKEGLEQFAKAIKKSKAEMPRGGLIPTFMPMSRKERERHDQDKAAWEEINQLRSELKQALARIKELEENGQHGKR